MKRRGLSPAGTATLRAGLPIVTRPAFPHALAARLADTEAGAAPLALAWELVRLAAPAERDALGAILLVLAVLDAASSGSTALRTADRARTLGRAAELGLEPAERAALAVALDAVERGALADAGLATIVGGPGDARPLVLDEGRLALSRHVALEARLASALARRARTFAPTPALEAALARAGVLESPTGPVALTDEQRAALRTAVLGAQSVIAGGPGAGKTSIVAALVRALAGGPSPIVPPVSVALAAPTGKAADRIFASLSATLAAERTLLDALAPAETLHRLLGYRAHDGSFTFHAQNPLPQRLVVVDEASMLDLALAERLVAALAPDARLVLLGDPDQLPSVDAGAVLADLVALASSPDATPVPVARLAMSHRTDARDPGGADVRRVAAAVRTGALEASALPRYATVRDAAAHASGVALVAPASPAELAAVLRAVHARSFAPVLEAAREPVDLGSDEGRARVSGWLAELGRLRLLTVTRGAARATGTDALNALLAVQAGAPPGAFVPGEPLLVHRNDYDRELLNGDQGLVVRAAQAGGSALVGVFRRAGRLVHHPLEALSGTVERAYASTVHKAQGSEHEHVVLVLPEADIALLGRELVYTAVTRARRSVLILGDPGLLTAGVKRASHRVTGLRTALARNGQGPVRA
jgi:exodeoxyribonuclease V alpha subunit